MADGRKIPYLIELAADDKKIRQQMSKINWEEILGSKGKGFGDVLVSDAKEAKDQIKKTLGGLDIDWSKILGAKEIGQLEQAVTKALSKSRKEIELFAAGGDTTGLEKTIKYVSALGNELKGLGSSFDAASLARGMGAFMKVLTPLTSKFESLADEPQKIEAAFDKLFSGSIVNGATHVNKAVESIAKTTEKTINVFARMDGVLKSQGGLEKTRESLEALYDLLSSNAKLPDFSGMSIEQLLRQVQKLDEQWDEIDKKSNFGAYTKEQDAQVAHIMAQLVQIDKLLPKDKKILVPVEFNGQQFGASVEDYEKDIKETATNIKKELDEVEEKIKKSLGDSFAEVISKQVSDIKLNLSINNESKEKLIASINEYVAELNKSPIDKIKLQLGDADVANVIENKSKRAYGNNVEDDDVNTTKLIEQTEKRFKGVRGAMYRNQNKILQQTKEWRQQMLEQFKFKSDDFEFKFNNNLIEELQSLFDEYGLKINIDPTYLADQIKTVLEGSSVSLSSGTASIEPSTMASAVAAGVRAALVGEPLTVHTLVNSAQERIPDATEQVVTEIEEVAKHLDVSDEYVQDVVKKIKAVAKYAVKPADKDNVGAKATREQFKLLGIDLEKVFGATNDSQIATILENSLLKRGDFNKLVGSTVIDELSTFKGSSSNTISAFVNSLREMFYMLQEDTETVDEWNRKKHSREIFDYARGQAKAASSLRDVRSSIRTDKIPDIEYIDKAIAAMSAIGKNTDSLTTLKLAREKLGDKTDEQSIQEFNAVANEFYKNTTKVFYDIKKQAEDSFKGTVYFQGNKKGVVKKQNIESYKQLAKIGDDDVILDIRVTSSLNNVSLGTTKSKYKDRISPYEEKRLLDGKRGDYIVSPEYEKDILNRELEYGGFKPQGASTTDVNLDATLEANIKKREVLMAEIKANEEEKKLLKDQIDAADKQIADLTAKNNEIPQGRRDAALRKIADQEAKKSTLTNDIFWLEEQVGNGKEGDEQKVGSLTKQIEEQLGKRAIAERQLAELSELDVERRKKSLTNKVAEIEQDDLPKLQEELTKAQTKYSTANSEKILAQVEVNKANSALKAIPKNKANAEARAEAEARVHKANSELIRATERFEEASRDIDSITNQIENSKRKIENLQDQISGTTLETIRQEQIARIEAIDNAITSLENEFASKLAEKKAKETALKRTNATIDRARNNAALKTQYDLNSEVASKKSLEGRYKEVENNDKILQHEIDLTTSREIGIKKQKEYVALQEKVLMLQGQITKLEADGAKDDQIDAKRNELKVVQETIAVLDKERDETYREYNELKQKLPVLQDALRRGMPSEQFEKAEEDIKSIIKRIDELQNKINALGVGLGVREAREYTDVERKTYALDQIKLIDNDLITARAQKNVVAARIAKKDREIAEVDRWGLGAGIGARTLNQEKYQATSEFMNSDYVRSLIDEAREQTKAAIEKAIKKSELAETNMTSEFNDRVMNAMLRDGLNPYSDEQTKQFLQSERGKQYSQDHNVAITSIRSELEEITRSMWALYDERVKTIRSQVSAEFKESIKVDNGVLSYISKIRNESGEWVNELVEVYVRDALRKRLVDAKEILEEEQTPIQTNIDRLYADRKTAIEYGGVGEKEILSADIIEDQIRKEGDLAVKQAERAESLQKISDLEQAGVANSDESIKQEKKKLAEIEKQIARLEMLVRNRQKLVDIRWDESNADSYTNEEKELHFTEQVVNYNQKIEDSLVRQEALKQKIANSSEEEKIKLQYQLSKEESNVKKWRKGISTVEGQLHQIEIAKSATNTTETSSESIVSLIKEALGNTNVDVTPVTDILNKILSILNGVQITTITEEPPYKEIAGEKVKAVAKIDNTTDAAWKELNTLAKKAYNEEKSGDKQLSDVIKGLIDKIKDPKVDDKTKMSLQVALQKAINDFGKDNKSTKGLEYKTNKKGHQYLPLDEIDKYLGLAEGTVKTLKLTKEQALKQLENEKFKTQETVKQVENEKKQVEQSKSNTTSGLGSLAREDTLSKILEVLNAFKNDGVKTTSKKHSEKEEKPSKKTEAELIKERALKDKDAVLGIASNSKIKKKYEQLVKQLESETDLGRIKALAQKTSALGFNIKKESAEWDYKTADVNRVYNIPNVNTFGKRPETVRKSMEKLAQTKFNQDGKQYEFLNFDGTKLVYQLTDIKGNVEKVTMEWSELNNQVAITSDKSSSVLDTLANKVETFEEKFKNAIQMGYLSGDDNTYKQFLDKVANINSQSTFQDVEKARNEALQTADEVTKKISENKKLYTGTTEMNAADRQYKNLEASGILDQADLKTVEAYKNSYKKIATIHNDLVSKKNGVGLLDPEGQKQLREAALDAKNLGKELEKSASNSQRLQQLVDNSGSINGKAIGDFSPLQEGVDMYDAMRRKLEELGATNIKIDKIHKTATGTIRHNNKMVSDLTVEYDKLTNSLGRYQRQERESLTGLPAFLNGFQKKFNSIMQYLSMTMSIHRVISELRRGVQYIREIDLALTELKKVTDETEATYDNFLKTAAKTGARLGSTISAVTEATATFAKLGYNMKQAAEMAEAAIVYKNVGDNIASTGDAADSIISTLKGFGLEASESMAIVDKFNEVGNRFAITSQGIGEALRLSASALNEGKNSLDESIALITAANEVVNDPSSVGTALKTLTLRLRGSKTELEEMGEDISDMATTTSQLQAKLLALTGGKVDIMLDANTFKNSTQILREMADAWEDMNDIQRASALELMGGKRQANTLSALIQNFDTVEKVIETSAQSSGSALRENERYLDSIQGKIDQFTNATQEMWNNFLDADAVKFIVELGTKLIKFVDTLGLIPSILISIGAFKGLRILFKGADITGLIQSISALTMGTKVFEAETRKASMALIGETIDAKLASSALVEYAIKMKLATSSDVAKMTTTQLLGLSFKALATAIVEATKAIIAFLFTNPVGWAILAATAVIGVIAAWNKWGATTENLTEKLNDLKSELSDIQSELDSLNSELETTQDRIAELLAMDKLSFTEEEELKRLRKQNDELQREIDLQKTLQNSKQKEVNVAFKEVMQKKLDKNYTKDNVNGFNGTYTKKSNLLSALVHGQVSGEEALRTNIDQYLSKVKLVDSLEEQSIHAQSIINDPELSWFDKLGQKAYITSYENGKESLDALEKSISDQLLEYKSDIEGIEYGDDEEVNAYLDYVNNMLDRWAITSGGENAKTNALSRIFNKDENAAISDSIDDYVEALKKGDTSAKTSIENIIKNNKALVEDIEASGLSLDDAVNYFTSFASEANYATIDGKLKEVDEATRRLKTALSENFDVSNLDSIKQALTDKGWVDSDGNLMSDVIAEYFGGENGGISEKTRTEIERLVKQIYDGNISVQDALKSFELFGVQSVIEIQIEEVKTNFKDVFVDLEDVDGLINTFEELGEAIGSTVGALEAFNQAQADVADKGFVSIQTALQLMEYTDDYSSVLKVVDGRLQLVENAEQNLIQARIKAIKVSAQTAVADAQAAYDKAELAVQSYRSAMVEEASASTVATAWQKIVAVAAGIKNALDNIWSGESISSLYNSGYNTYLESATGYKTTYDDAGLQALKEALADADKKLNEAKDNAEIANALSADNLEDLYESSDKSTKDEVEDDAFQREMDYWENRIAANQAKYGQLQNEIDRLESRGQKAGAGYYEEQIKLEGQRFSLLKQQKAAAQAHLATLEEGSDEWWEVADVLNGIEDDIDDVTASIVELQDAIGDIETYKFEELNTRLDNLASKLGTIRDLIAPNGEEDWFDDEGNWTENGIAALATYVQELEFYKQGYKDTVDELAKYQLEYSTNEDYYESIGIHSEQELYDKTEELISQQYDYASSINDTEQSVVDMYESSIDAAEEYINTLIDGYNDYIDSVKEALDAERDLYDFKKNVQEQAKDIAELERRIASLSGSTNKSDIAERRKLEAQLYESRESLNDTYYDHAKDAQQEALDAEASAYEETMIKMVEGMRMSFEEATAEMDTFLNNVTIAVSMNADTVLAKYKETNIYLDPALTNPWENAKTAVGNYGGDATKLMDVWKQGGYFAEFSSTAGANLSSPWNKGTNAVNAFKSSVTLAMNNVVSDINSNVNTAAGSLSKLYQQIKDTEARAASAKANIENDLSRTQNVTGGNGSITSSIATVTATLNSSGKKFEAARTAKNESEARKAAKDAVIQLAYDYYRNRGYDDAWLDRKYSSWNSSVTYHAKGTLGTKRDEWAITDEPRFGDELVLVPGKDGNLSFMRKGTSVVPAEITTNLMEWGQFTPDAMSLGGGVNVNMINNSVMKPQYDLSFDSLVHVDNCSQETLKDLEKMVDNKINKFSKELNYSIKKFAR